MPFYPFALDPTHTLRFECRHTHIFVRLIRDGHYLNRDQTVHVYGLSRFARGEDDSFEIHHGLTVSARGGAVRVEWEGCWVVEGGDVGALRVLLGEVVSCNGGMNLANS